MTHFGTTSNVRKFASAAERSAAENLEKFVSDARAENPIGVADWDSTLWLFPKGSRASASSDGGLQFTVRSANTKEPGVIPEPFMSFLKAIVCKYNQRSGKLYSVGNSQCLIAAGRFLYDVIKDKSSDSAEPYRGNDSPNLDRVKEHTTEHNLCGNPITLTHGDFEEAAARIRAHYSTGAAPCNSKLKFISDEMDRHGLTPLPIGYKTSIKVPDKHDRVGPEATKRRHEKLPGTDALSALAEISASNDLDDRDLIVQRSIDFLACGGFRLNEVLTLPRNALKEEPILDDNGIPMLDAFGRPAVRVGLRYWPEKGGHRETQIKWLPTAMIDLAKRAISDVLRITEPSAAVARYQRDHKDDTLLAEPWRSMPPDTLLSTRDVAEAVGLTTDNANGGASAGLQFLEPIRSKVIRVGKQHFISRKDLGAYLWERSFQGNVLNSDVGYLDIADALFVIPVFFIKRTLKRGLNGAVQLLKDSIIQVSLVSQANGIQPSIFERRGYNDASGQPLRINSHQFRHMMNTLAAEGSMSEAEVARWMGRTKISQNKAYQHVTPMVMAERLQGRFRAGEAIGPIAEKIARINDPVRREEFIKTTSHTNHLTDLGGCAHPWDALPCSEHGACADCSEHRFIKGDPTSRERAVKNLAEIDELLAAAHAEGSDGTYGVDNWLVAHERQARALRRIIAAHDNHAVPDGTIVQLPKDVDAKTQ